MFKDLLTDEITRYLEAKMGDGLCLALSGGVDSALLLHFLAKSKAGGGHVLAVTFDTGLHPVEDLELASKLAADYGIRHMVIPVEVLSDPYLQQNPPDRCYRCKTLLFARLKATAAQEGLGWLLDGTNADDLQQYRPGIKALQEHGVCSPWAELNVTKAQIRALARKVNLSVANRPSAPCMATRFPYGARLNLNVMQKLNTGENLLKNMGFAAVRLRYYDGLLRIEVAESEFAAILRLKTEITAMLKQLGFKYITLDLEGFRSGSMDE